MTAIETGENVIMRVEGNKLIIEVDLTHVGELSSTGKSRTVASTKGNKPVPGHDTIMIGLNVYKPVKGGRLDRTRGRRQHTDTAPLASIAIKLFKQGEQDEQRNTPRTSPHQCN